MTFSLTYFADMNLDRVSSDHDIPNYFNVIIKIPVNADPIKYEVDKDTSAMFVDRFMSTYKHYPCNYGYIRPLYQMTTTRLMALHQSVHYRHRCTLPPTGDAKMTNG